MKTHHIADGVRIWQEESTKQEQECPVSFLWSEVVKVESEHGSDIQWQNRSPKTFITLGGESDSTFCVIGSYKRWREKWERYFQAEAQARFIAFSN
jgi:hypothetical protein